MGRQRSAQDAGARHRTQPTCGTPAGPLPGRHGSAAAAASWAHLPYICACAPAPVHVSVPAARCVGPSLHQQASSLGVRVLQPASHTADSGLAGQESTSGVFVAQVDRVSCTPGQLPILAQTTPPCNPLICGPQKLSAQQSATFLTSDLRKSAPGNLTGPDCSS